CADLPTPGRSPITIACFSVTPPYIMSISSQHVGMNPVCTSYWVILFSSCVASLQKDSQSLTDSITCTSLYYSGLADRVSIPSFARLISTYLSCITSRLAASSRKIKHHGSICADVVTFCVRSVKNQ